MPRMRACVHACTKDADFEQDTSRSQPSSGKKSISSGRSPVSKECLEASVQCPMLSLYAASIGNQGMRFLIHTMFDTAVNVAMDHELQLDNLFFARNDCKLLSRALAT